MVTNQDSTFLVELTRLPDHFKFTGTKKFGHFVDLKSELESLGYLDLPPLPESKFFGFFMT